MAEKLKLGETTATQVEKVNNLIDEVAELGATEAPNPTDYYWANVKVSASSNTNTTPTFNPAFKVNLTTNLALSPSTDGSNAYASPIPKYLWHDLLGFGVNGIPTVEYSTDGSTWTASTDTKFTKKLFINREDQGVTTINDSRPYMRWTWGKQTQFHACKASWLIIGFAYTSSAATNTVTIENSGDGTTWTTLATKSLKGNQAPYWFKLVDSWSSKYYFRITFQRTSAAGTSTSLSSIKLLTGRWGNQGRGSEYEYPYAWDEEANIFYRSSASTLGTEEMPWAAVYDTALYENGTALSTKYLNKTDEAPQSIAGSLTLPNLAIGNSAAGITFLTGTTTWTTIKKGSDTTENVDLTLPTTSGTLALQTEVDGKLDKTTYEWNEEITFTGSDNGKALLIGKFPCYDTNLTVEIKSTTNTTYYGQLVIATQNIKADNAGTIKANVYGDATNTLASALTVVRESLSTRVIAIYFKPANYSKHLIHVQAVALNAAPTDMLTKVDAVPTTDDGVYAIVKPTNQLTASFLGITATAANATKFDGRTIIDSSDTLVFDDNTVLTSLALYNHVSIIDTKADEANNMAVAASATAESAYQNARTAQTTAENAQTTADNALTTAENVSATAEEALKEAKYAYQYASGVARSYVFDTQDDMINALNEASASKYKVGDTLYIKDTGVPDYWVIDVYETNDNEYGYYNIAPLETESDITALITGGASTITTSDLSVNKALISNSSGKVAASAVTSTELGYLSGVTSNVQTQLDNKLPLSGGTLTGELITDDLTVKGTEVFYTRYAKKMIGTLNIGTKYDSLDDTYKDGTYHRMWRLRFPANCRFWGKIKVTLYGGYSSGNASGVLSKSITCNFNESTIYNNVGYYDGLGVNVEKDFRISEAIWNSTAGAWEILIWQYNLSWNNSPCVYLEGWFGSSDSTSATYLANFNNITAQTVELTQDTTYTASKASSTGGTKTVTWADTPVYENPLGLEIATVENTIKSLSISGKTITYTKGDGTTGTLTTQDTNTTYSVATASTAGLVKPVSVITKPTLNSVTSTSGKYYQVQMSSDGNMFVNVPWTDTNTNTDTKVTQARRTADENRPLLMSAGFTATDTGGSSASTAYWNNYLFANPSSGALYANTFYESGIALNETYAPKKAGLYYVRDYNTTTEGTWLGVSSDITELYDGLAIVYKVPVKGASTTTLNINSLGAKTVYMRGTTKVTTHYAVGTMLQLTYNATTDAWYTTDYDANSNVTQTNTTADAEYRLLFSYNASDTTETKGARKSTNFKVNPSTGALGATSFLENGTAL